MRHRLYYLLPDIDSARRTMDDLLLSRIEERYVHFMTGGAPLPSELPEANFLHKTDVINGAESGMLVGSILGIAFGFLLVSYYDLAISEALVVVSTTLIGLLFGGWAASMAAAALPNSRLKPFIAELERGRVLLIADIPARRIGQIEKMLAERHPEMRFSGEDPRIPAFP